MTRKKKRLSLILGGLAVLGLAAGLVLYALSDTITFFHTPSDLTETGVQPGQRIRLGGMVEETLKQSLLIFGDDLTGFLSRPIAMTLIVVTLAGLFWPLLARLFRGRRSAQA